MRSSRRTATRRRLRKIMLNATGLLVFVLAVFPVLWMASTAPRAWRPSGAPSA